MNNDNGTSTLIVPGGVPHRLDFHTGRSLQSGRWLELLTWATTIRSRGTAKMQTSAPSSDFPWRKLGAGTGNSKCVCRMSRCADRSGHLA
jgi:hypothetical protein